MLIIVNGIIPRERDQVVYQLKKKLAKTLIIEEDLLREHTKNGSLERSGVESMISDIKIIVEDRSDHDLMIISADFRYFELIDALINDQRDVIITVRPPQLDYDLNNPKGYLLRSDEFDVDAFVENHQLHEYIRRDSDFII